MFSIKGGIELEDDGSTEESWLDTYWLHKIKQGHCFWPLPSSACRKITWFPCIGSKTTDCRIIIKGGLECWLGVWMESYYQKSGFASWGVLNQKIQLSQSSWEGKVYYLKKYGEHQGAFQSNVSPNYSWGSFNLLEQACSGFPGGSDGKESACSAGDLGLIPGSGRSPGGGHGSPLQYSYLENPMDRGAWQATVHRVGKSQTQLKWFSMHAVSVVAVPSWLSSIDGGGFSFLHTLSSLGSL